MKTTSKTKEEELMLSLLVMGLRRKREEVEKKIARETRTGS